TPRAPTFTRSLRLGLGDLPAPSLIPPSARRQTEMLAVRMEPKNSGIWISRQIGSGILPSRCYPCSHGCPTPPTRHRRPPRSPDVRDGTAQWGGWRVYVPRRSPLQTLAAVVQTTREACPEAGYGLRIRGVERPQFGWVRNSSLVWVPEVGADQ